MPNIPKAWRKINNAEEFAKDLPYNLLDISGLLNDDDAAVSDG